MIDKKILIFSYTNRSISTPVSRWVGCVVVISELLEKVSEAGSLEIIALDPGRGCH